MPRSPTSAVAALLVLLLVGCSLAGPPAGRGGGAGGTGAPEPSAGAEGADASGPGAAGARGAVRGSGDTAWMLRDLPPPVTSPFPEVRGLWVVRFSLTSPEAVRAVVRRAEEGGFNTLLVQVRGRGDAYFRGGVEPPAEGLRDASPGFDPLALLVREAHARGIHVHAWLNTFLVAGVGPLPADRRHIVHARPEWLAVPRELARDLFPMDPRDPRYVRSLLEWSSLHTDRVEGLFASPANPRAQEHLYRIWMDVVERYGVDGVHFDYVRYPDRGYDYSRGSLEAFREWLVGRIDEERWAELDQRYRTDPLALPEGAPEEWDAFRLDQVSGVVERIVRGAKARRPELLVSAAVFPDADAARRLRFQDWRAWLRSGLLDVAVPMAYTPDDARFRALVADAREGVDRGRVWAGIGVYRTTYAGTVRKVRIAREVDAGGIVLFSYDWAVSEGESSGGMPFLTRLGRALF